MSAVPYFLIHLEVNFYTAFNGANYIKLFLPRILSNHQEYEKWFIAKITRFHIERSYKSDFSCCPELPKAV